MDSSATFEAFPGEVIAGKYRIERVLGTGGMGTVVAATHLELGGLVALKFLNPGVVDQAEALARFQREARAMFALRGENVGRILDVGRLPTKGPFIVMEYLEGADLERASEGRPMEVPRAVGYVLQACAAVAEAHLAGIVHRDLKPQNLFIASRPDGSEVVKVLDFGISKMRASSDMSLTATSAMMGSPRYMAPEQYESAALADARTDIWALGAVLFKLLTGEVPYDGDNAYGVLSKILREPPPSPRRFRADLPEGLANAVLHALARRPADRFQSIADFAAAIAPYASADASPPLPAAMAKTFFSSPPPPLTVMPATSATEGPITRSMVPELRAPRRRSVLFGFVMVVAASGLVVAGIASRGRFAEPTASAIATADPPANDRAQPDPAVADPSRGMASGTATGTPSAPSTAQPADIAPPSASASVPAAISTSARGGPRPPPARRSAVHPRGGAAPAGSASRDLMKENW